MISICIPVFNFNISTLIQEISKQAEKSGVPYEIIIIDDCSQEFKAENKIAAEAFEYIELPKNIGRAKIRNRFLDFAKYDYLLFLDCDSLIHKDDFIQTYVEALDSSPVIVCGGRVYPSTPPVRNKMLSWKHGIHRESKSAEVRRKEPNKSFMTNNFLIKKECLKEIKFDERITKYGHEDTLFGYALAQHNIEILHIENPVLNGDIETNEVFINKTKEGVINLVNIHFFLDYDQSFIEKVSLLKYAHRTKSTIKLQLILFHIFKNPILFFLKKGYVNLKLFDFYKLGIFLSYRHNYSN